jgi:hypothetical protein
MICGYRMKASGSLFNFFVNRYFLEISIVFLQLQTLWIVLFVLGSDITAGTGHTGCFLLCAFQYYLYAVSFLCHCLDFIFRETRSLNNQLNMLTLSPQFFYHIEQTILVDGTDTLCCQLQGNPFVFFSQEKLLCLQIR